MDYSLLIVVLRSDYEPELADMRGVYWDAVEDLCYVIGIIDFLQLYTMQKRFEHLAKSMASPGSSQEISA
jgi:hypothetical protein